MRARYIVSEILQGLWRNLTMVISVVIVTAVSLTFVGAGLVMQKEIVELRHTLVQESQVTIYLCSKHSTAASCAGGPATDAQIGEVRDALRSETLRPYVASFTERDQKEALEIYRKQFADQPFAADMKAEDMPVSFHITLKDSGRSDAVVQFFQGRDGVDEVKDLLSVYAPVIALMNHSTMFAGGLALLMLVAAVLLVFTTIRMSVANRRREISIMRLVGASNLFIRAPFLMEGAVAAVIGALMATGVLWLGLRYLVQGWLTRALGTQVVRVGVPDLWWIGPVLVALGAILAIAASVVSLNRHLRT